MSPAGWGAVTRAAERTAPTMNAQDAANTLNALCNLHAAASAMSPAGWDVVARAAERTAPTMNAQGRASILNALKKLKSIKALKGISMKREIFQQRKVHTYCTQI